MLRRRTDRERHKIALWINENEARPAREVRQSRDQRLQPAAASEIVPLAPHGGIFGSPRGPLGDRRAGAAHCTPERNAGDEAAEGAM